MKIKSYAIIERAVEEGVAYGYHRAFKYDDKPTEETIKQAIIDAVMLEISEVIDFDNSQSELESEVRCLQELNNML